MTTNGYYQTLDENFNTAYELLRNNQNHNELIDMLKNGNIVQKQLAALKLDTLNNEKEAIKRDISEIENIAKAGPIAYADYYIDNNKTIDDFKNRLEEILKELERTKE